MEQRTLIFLDPNILSQPKNFYSLKSRYIVHIFAADFMTLDVFHV